MKIPFRFTMSRGAHAALAVWLLVYTVALPLLIQWHAAAWPGAVTQLQYNVVYLLLSFTAVLILAWRYLRSEFDTLLDRKLLSLFTLIQGYFIYMALSYFLLLGVVMITGGELG